MYKTASRFVIYRCMVMIGMYFVIVIMERTDQAQTWLLRLFGRACCFGTQTHSSSPSNACTTKLSAPACSRLISHARCWVHVSSSSSTPLAPAPGAGAVSVSSSGSSKVTFCILLCISKVSSSSSSNRASSSVSVVLEMSSLCSAVFEVFILLGPA